MQGLLKKKIEAKVNDLIFLRQRVAEKKKKKYDKNLTNAGKRIS